MRETFKSGSVGRAPGNWCLYLEGDKWKRSGADARAKALGLRLIKTVILKIKMINEFEQKYIEDLIAFSEESLSLLSNREKAKRERMVAAAFLRCIGISFTPSDIESPRDDPPDIIFQDASFEVIELLDNGRKRGDEFRERHEELTQAKSIEDTMQPYKPPSPISYLQILELITAALSKKASRYGKNVCSNLDALVYANLKDTFLDINTGMANFDTLMTQGWRSVSFVKPPCSHVVFAQGTASSFLRENIGVTKQKWKESDSFFGLH